MRERKDDFNPVPLGCTNVGADLATRRVPSVTTVFPVSMHLAAGTRQITREQREITI